MSNIINQRFGQREVTDVVFKAKRTMKLGPYTFTEGQPVLFIDSATASTVEQASTTVYARGGRGNARLIAWEGEKELTFTVTDALLSPISYAIFSGANLFTEKDDGTTKVHVHITARAYAGTDGKVDLSDALLSTDDIISNEKESNVLFVMPADENDGSIVPQVLTATVDEAASGGHAQTITVKNGEAAYTGPVFVDCYVLRAASSVAELQISAENFAGYFYVEASTLFRAEADGHDMPVEMTLPNVKVQSNFTFSMSPTGDPTTFEFTMDAMPGYTKFNSVKKELMVMQVVNEDAAEENDTTTVMGAVGE